MKENLELLDQEETYWHNRCHEEWFLKGDNNTKYFHKIASGKKRKNTVISLEHDGNIIEGDENIIKHATEYYSDLFGPGEEHDIHIDNSLWDELEHISESDNIHLCEPFTESEIKEALF
jgi:mannosylglycoprotein endo-beta-mannosidase